MIIMPFRSPYSQVLFDYADKLAELRRANPQEDLTTRLFLARHGTEQGAGSPSDVQKSLHRIQDAATQARDANRRAK